MLAHTLGWCLTGFALCSAGYAFIVSWFVVRYGQESGHAAAPVPVTILKPLHLDEPDLSRTLSTFLAQDYPAPVQIVFGVQDPSDPAIAVVRGLQCDHPRADIQLVIDSQLHGSNRKVSNLINMARAATHDVLIVSDSDISVARDWLSRVTGALDGCGVGAVSCLYAGKAGGNLWSALAAMGTTYEFLPNVIAGLSFGLAAPCFGSTIALRRATLDAIGGFRAFANQLADDYEMGRAVRAKGLRVAIPAFAVEHAGAEKNWTDLYRHELRWNRTTHAIDSTGHTLSFITHALPLSLMAALVSHFSISADAVVAFTLVSRICLKWCIEQKFSISSGPAWALPARDLLSFLIFLASFFGEDVHWRGSRFAVTQGGQLRSHEA
jgi:ceramide glucosyltransferase